MKRARLFGIVLGTLFSPYLFVFAQGSDDRKLAGVVADLYQFALLVAGLLAFGAIVYGAIKYAISGGNAESQKDAKTWIRSAISGLILLTGATVILNLINPELTRLQIEPPIVPAAPSADRTFGSASTSTQRFGCIDSDGFVRCSVLSSCSDIGVTCNESGNSCTQFPQTACNKKGASSPPKEVPEVRR